MGRPQQERPPGYELDGQRRGEGQPPRPRDAAKNIVKPDASSPAARPTRPAATRPESHAGPPRAARADPR
ncbi:hypothetical protein I553_2703 [Mycobacterium xenopi 4042]|uniref:Uncharacterized protein n=1 Tax=Mycobacterium xenopi 4042 TaxID=1299334 RepID=X8CKL4_MYCXE|nr:hypothetical protein I553_2703 [Mycobacterium xenopi 4042]